MRATVWQIMKLWSSIYRKQNCWKLLWKIQCPTYQATKDMPILSDEVFKIIFYKIKRTQNGNLLKWDEMKMSSMYSRDQTFLKNMTFTRTKIYTIIVLFISGYYNSIRFTFNAKLINQISILSLWKSNPESSNGNFHCRIQAKKSAFWILCNWQLTQNLDASWSKFKQESLSKSNVDLQMNQI